MADPAFGAQAAAFRNHRRKQFIGMQAALDQHLDVATGRQFHRPRRRCMAVLCLLDPEAVKRDPGLGGRRANLCAGTDQDRVKQAFVAHLDRAKDRGFRTGMHHRRPHRGQCAGLFDKALPAPLRQDHRLGKVTRHPGHLLDRGQHQRLARKHHLAPLIAGGGRQADTVLALDQLGHFNFGGDGIAWRNRLVKADLLVEIDRPRPRQAGAQHRRNQRRSPHAVHHDMAKRPMGGETGIQMRGVGVAGNSGEQFNILGTDVADKTGAVADFHLVKQIVGQSAGHLVTSGKHMCRAHLPARCPLRAARRPWPRAGPSRTRTGSRSRRA